MNTLSPNSLQDNESAEIQNNQISIIGTCVCRDTFGMHENDGGFQVNRYLFTCNPISLVGKSPKLSFDNEKYLEVMTGRVGVDRRCMRTDLQKSWIRYMKQKPSCWLMLDTGELRKDLVITKEGILTDSFPLITERLYQAGFIGSYEIKKTADYSTEYLHKRLKRYFDRVLEMYPEEKMIFLELKALTQCVDLQNNTTKVVDESEAEYINQWVSFGMDYVRDRFPNAHYIPFPDYMVRDEHHKWGPYVYHYVKEFYDYSYEAVKVITSGRYGPEEEKEEIEKLRRNCSELTEKKYSCCFNPGLLTRVKWRLKK
ncbi:MAG: hypothetical protein IKF90_26305 [Parasporobacterium sp.]|nr:hypothetical protein [Parasporobacterium sp.]